MTQTFVRKTDRLVHVSLEGDEIVTTPEHPFYVDGKGWTKAGQLRAGSILVLREGRRVPVGKVWNEISESPTTVYNFEVADYHTYFVGEGGVLVHNKPVVNGDIPKKPRVTGPQIMTAAQAKAAAEKLGFTKIKKLSNGQPVFKKGRRYITPDVGSGNGMGSHNGGVWKMADSVENLAKRETRMGTYDANLNRIGD